MKAVIFDIETGPRPEAELAGVTPDFKAPSNYKDPEKIAAAIQEQKDEWMGRAALSAVTGRVIAIGLRWNGENTILTEDLGEAAMLTTFWVAVEEAARMRRTLVGFNSNGFDIPFLVRRSWAHGVKVPAGLFGFKNYVNPEFFIDLMDVWGCGNRMDRIKLDHLAALLGVEQKSGDGKFFSQTWATDKAAAIAYLEQDLKVTAQVMERLLGISELGVCQIGAPAPEVPKVAKPRATKKVAPAAPAPAAPAPEPAASPWPVSAVPASDDY